MKIHLLHVNDVHSQLENYMRMGYHLRRLRQELRRRGDAVLTLDLGDVLDRVRPETEATLGLVNAALMASLQVDLWVFGNNEGLTIPVEQWPALVDRSDATALAANFRQLSGQPFPFFQDSKVFHLNGIKVGIFGVTANYVKPYNMLGVKALHPFEQAGRMIKDLRAASCDVVIAMSHLGLHEDRELAKRVEGLDLILGSHTHQFMSGPEWVGKTAIFQPGKHALVFGHTEIEVDAGSRRIVSLTSRPIPVDERGELDQEMLSSYQGYLPDIEQRLSETVTELEHPLPVWFDRESLFGNVLVDALFDAFPCDLGMIMTGALTASMLAGRVQIRHVLGACSTPTRPIKMTLTGKQIQSVLNKSIHPDYFFRQGFGYGFRGSVVGYLALANAIVELSEDGDSLHIEQVWIDGKPLHPERTYRVVTSEYLWLAPVFEELRRGEDIEYERPLVRELLLGYLHHGNCMDTAQNQRYRKIL